MSNNNVVFRLLELQIIISDLYFSILKQIYVTNVYYIVYIDKVPTYNSDLPITVQELADQLDEAGFRIYQNVSYKIKNIYIDLNDSAVIFNFNKTATALQSSWHNYLTTSNVTELNFSNSDISIKVFEQNLYFDQSKPIIGIKYIVSLRGYDPCYYAIIDPLNAYFNATFSPLTIVSSKPLLARRMYAYSALFKSSNDFTNESLMKSRIANIWVQKNIANYNVALRKDMIFELILALYSILTKPNFNF